MIALGGGGGVRDLKKRLELMNETMDIGNKGTTNACK